MVKQKHSLIKGTTTIKDVELEINNKRVDVEVQTYSSDIDMGGDMQYVFISDEKMLTEEEKEEIDAFINDNY